MRYISLALTLVAHAATAQRPYDLPIRNAPVRTIAEFPGVNIGRISPSGNPNRLYYNVGDKLYVFDVSTRKSALVAEGDIWNLDISPTNDRLVFARDVEGGKVSNVWTMSLDPKTGLATAPARRLALTPGDQPRVSPDGKWVAFAAYDSSDWSATQHLAIIGADGGAERVVARLKGGIWRVHWAPDGRTIYFATGRGDKRGARLLRVSVAGGPVDTLGIEFNAGPSPGPSPDGRFLALIEDGSVSNYVVADARGVPVSRFSVALPGHVGWVWDPAWNGSRTLVGNGTYTKNAVRLADLGNGTSREIVPADLQAEAPFWSPDGESIATFATSQRRRVLLVVDATTGKRKEFTAGIVQSCCVHGESQALEWSPDGKAIAFRGEYRKPLRVIDLATGAVRQVGAGATLIDEYRWRSDSRALQYTATANPRDAYRTIHETTVDGNDRVLIDRIPNGVGTAGMRNDTTAVVSSDSGVFLISVRTRAWTRLGPQFSPWVASNRQGTTFVMRSFQNRRLELATVDADGTRASTLNLPLLTEWAPYNQPPLAFHPDGRLILQGRATGGLSAVYATDPKGGEPRKLLNLPDRGRPYLDLSPDGRFLAYTVGPTTSVIAQIDLTSFVPATQSTKRNP